MYSILGWFTTLPNHDAYHKTTCGMRLWGLNIGYLSQYWKRVLVEARVQRRRTQHLTARRALVRDTLLTRPNTGPDTTTHTQTTAWQQRSCDHTTPWQAHGRKQPRQTPAYKTWHKTRHDINRKQHSKHGEHMRPARMNPFSLDKILVANMPWLPSKTTTEWGVQVRLITANRR